MHVFYTRKLERCLFCACVERVTSCISCRRPGHLCKTRDFGQIPDTHCEVGGYQPREARRSIHGHLWSTLSLNTCCSMQESGRRGLAVSCTEQKGLNLHDENNRSRCWQTTVHYRCETSFSARDKMSAIQSRVTNTCRLDTRLERNTTLDLTLYLMIPATKPNDLSKQLKNVMGYSDADWAGDPMTRKEHFLYIVLC